MGESMRAGPRVAALLGAVLALLLTGCAQGKPAGPGPSADHEPVAKAAPAPPKFPALPVFPPPYPFGQVQAPMPPLAAGKVPVIKKIDTPKPYVFVTIDDGQITAPEAPDMIEQSGA